mmetsp:Transcript_19410/g.33017  ORF Transcript_19410/g.33017 Transcript_19410/m.33017 type:complete len:162 (+) Transcript_19410:43-528(+)
MSATPIPSISVLSMVHKYMGNFLDWLSVQDQVRAKADGAFSLLMNMAVIWGSFKIASTAWRLSGFFYRHLLLGMFQSKNRLYQLYNSKDEGKRSWAVVTGGSDGIGLAMCHNLAQQKFNICIVARNEQKIKEKLEEIKRAANDPLLEVNYVIADFSKLSSI